MTSRTLQMRFQGCILGAVFGDCLGAKFERVWDAVPCESVVKYYKTVTSKVKTKEEPERGFVLYTDDSCMTFDLGESLVKCNQFSPHDVAKSFSETFFSSSSQRFYGGHVQTVFYQLKASNYEGDMYHPASQQFSGSGSYGNGSAMRVSPVALFHHGDVPSIVKLAAEQSKITHTHPMGINGAILQALAIEKALNCENINDPVLFCQELISQLKDVTPVDDDVEIYQNKMDIVVSLLQSPNVAKAEEIDAKIGSDVTAQEAVPAAIFSFLYTLDPKRISQLKKYSGLRRAVTFAVAISRDSDTVGSMAGAIAGAYYGVEEISNEWKFACEGGDRALKLADDLYRINQKIATES